ALARREPGWVPIHVAAALAQRLERRPGVSETPEPAVGDAPVFDPRLVVARGLVPAQAKRPLAVFGGQTCGPEVRRLADVPVRVDDGLPIFGHSPAFIGRRSPVKDGAYAGSILPLLLHQLDLAGRPDAATRSVTAGKRRPPRCNPRASDRP